MASESAKNLEGTGVGSLLNRLMVSGDEPKVNPSDKDELAVKVLELRALVARLRAHERKTGIKVDGIDVDTAAFTGLVDGVDTDIGLSLAAELQPDKAIEHEIGGVVVRVKELLSMPDVKSSYVGLVDKLFAQKKNVRRLFALYAKEQNQLRKVAIVKQIARLIPSFLMWINDEEQNIHNQVVREGRGYRDGDLEVLAYLAKLKTTCNSELDRLQALDNEAKLQVRRDQIDVDAAVLRRRVPKEMRERNKGLSDGGYLVTPSRQKIIYGHEKEPVNSIVTALRKGANVELVGPTGTGKTRVAVHSAKVFSGKDPIVISGSANLSPAVFLGRPTDLSKRDPGAIMTCLKEGRGLVIDEDNRIDPNVLALIKFLLGLKRGDTYRHPETGETVVVPPTFGVIATRNEAGAHHKDRFQLPPDYRREFVKGSFEVGYFPPSELYDRFLIPKLCKDDGGMNLKETEVGGSVNDPRKRSPLLALSLAAEKIQQIYAKNELTDGVFESGFLIDFFDDWQEQHIKTDCSFIDFIEIKLIEFLRRPIGTPANPNRKKIIQVLVEQGFFADKKAESFITAADGKPVEDTELTAWRSGATKSVFMKVDPSMPDLDARSVALLDPFEIRKIAVAKHPMEDKVQQLKDQYVKVCSKLGIRPVSFTAATMMAKHDTIVNALVGGLGTVGNGAMLEGILKKPSSNLQDFISKLTRVCDLILSI